MKIANGIERDEKELRRRLRRPTEPSARKTDGDETAWVETRGSAASGPLGGRALGTLVLVRLLSDL